MATYLQGVTDYIPQVQPFQPDLNFYKGVLDVKESQYKEGYDRINRIYGYLMNSPLTRDVNIERRENYFNQIAGEIQRLSGVDLSLEQNVDAAYSVFKPLIDDNNVAKDMAWTNNLMSQYKRAEGFRNCTDEKLCGGKWWEGGVQALNFMREDFAKASDEEALGMGNARYTPYVNVMEKAFKAAKDMGFNVQSVRWTPDGRYIVTEKNGTQMVAPLNSFLQSTIGRDPLVTDLYNTQAYLERKNFSYGNTEKYGSEEAAERYYLSTKLAEIDAYSKQMEQSYNQMLNGIKTDKDVMDERIKNGEVDPEFDLDFFEYYDSLQEQENVINGVIDDNNNIKGLIDRSTLLDADITTMRRRVDSAVAGFKLGSDLLTASLNYAQLNNEVDIKADPYAEAQFKHSLDMAKLEKEQEYKIEFEQFKTAMGIVEDSYGGKKGSKTAARDPFNLSGLDGYVPLSGSETVGSTSQLEGLLNMMNTEVEESKSNKDVAGADYLGGLYQNLTAILNGSYSEARKEKARQSLVNLFNGQANVDKAIENGIIDKNFNPINGEKFDTFTKFVLNSDSGLMDRAYTTAVDTQKVGLLSNDTYSQLDGSYKQYSLYKQLYDSELKEYQESVKSVKDMIYEDINRNLGSNTKLAYESAIKNIENDTTLSETEKRVQKELAAKGYLGRADMEYLVMKPVGGDPIYSHYKSILNIFGDIGKRLGIIPTDNELKSVNKLLLDSFFDKNNLPVDKKTYVDKVLTEYKKQRSPLGMFWDVFNTSWNAKGFIEKAYDDTKKSFTREFESGRLKGLPQGTYRFSAPMQAQVDFANWQSESFTDVSSVLQNFMAKRDQPGVKILLGGNHTRNEYENADNNSTAEQLANLLFQAVNTDYDLSDANRPSVNFIGKPIALGSTDITAYEFVVNDNFLQSNPSTKKFFDKETGELKDDKSNHFTIYIDKNNVENTFYEKSKIGPYQKLFDAGSPISLTAGDKRDPDAVVNITKGANNTGLVNGYFTMINPVNGNKEKLSLNDLAQGSIDFNPATSNIDDITRYWQQKAYEIAERNRSVLTYLKNNRIR